MSGLRACQNQASPPRPRDKGARVHQCRYRALPEPQWGLESVADRTNPNHFVVLFWGLMLLNGSPKRILFKGFDARRVEEGLDDVPSSAYGVTVWDLDGLRASDMWPAVLIRRFRP